VDALLNHHHPSSSAFGPLIPRLARAPLTNFHSEVTTEEQTTLRFLLRPSRLGVRPNQRPENRKQTDPNEAKKVRMAYFGISNKPKDERTDRTGAVLEATEGTEKLPDG
jgi:hypothetical protein